jgi:hypothetical protein
MEDYPDTHFDSLLRNPLAILAERTWTSNAPARPLDAFLELLDNLMA